MLTILIISFIIVIIVLLLAVVTTSKAYQFKHTVDQFGDNTHLEEQTKVETNKK
ncbi:YtzI protein [Fredinandcohnia quinoae]|uniref:YtzI protein n=1 Tax=Fredinandcohnia quinoae TaxID=2918902 RepID=A0AAW5DZB7_9BACI|nr:YtzI protein [Fredinandcohnia sp. SECRCQ15]MCH1625423.1 YtzI protein [Fredinandcohnia sp. SECRCQ15]